jgi:raffinose/stachyose/melibiose transport system permease protein
MADFINRPLALPAHLHFDNYVVAFKEAELARHFLISIVITVTSVFLVVALAALAAFGFSRLDFAGKRLLYLSFFVGLILPIQSFLVGMFVQFRVVHLLNTLPAVILPVTALSLPIAVLLLKTYFDALPSSLEESATIEGAGALQIFWKIILPIGNAIIVTVVTFTTINVWNEFLIPFVMIQSDALKPLTTSLYVFSTKHSALLTLKLAALAIIATPMFIIYFVFQRQIQEGITAGAVKD